MLDPQKSEMICLCLTAGQQMKGTHKMEEMRIGEKL